MRRRSRRSTPGPMRSIECFWRNPSLSSLLRISQSEFYLTDVLSLALKAKRKVVTLAGDSSSALGVNSRADLAAVERILRDRKASEAMRGGDDDPAPRDDHARRNGRPRARHGARAVRDASREDARRARHRDRAGNGREGLGLREERDGEALLRDRVGGRRRRRGRGPVRAPARGNGPRRGRPRRELRRDEEGRAQEGRQGEPPDVPRRHGDRRAHERGRGRHHVQLRRLPEAQDDDRQRRLRRLGRRSSSRRSRSATAPSSRRARP